MKAVLQRVSEATVTPEGGDAAAIGAGLLILLGVADDDGEDDIEWLCDKVCHLRIFDDPDGVMNLSVLDTKGGLMVVSQFTLMASVRKGKRPSYVKAARPETAIPVYERFVARLEQGSGIKVRTGLFGAYMSVHLINDGPVTILLDSKRKE